MPSLQGDKVNLYWLGEEEVEEYLVPLYGSTSKARGLSVSKELGKALFGMTELELVTVSALRLMLTGVVVYIANIVL